MVDIVGELRHFAKGGVGDVSAACSDAITEIEFLRVYRSDVMAQVRNMTPLMEHLDRENSRLRETLATVQMFIKGEMIAHALVPEDGRDPVAQSLYGACGYVK